MANKKRYPPEGFPWRLYQVWLASGLTQKEAARKAGVERKAFGNWLYGETMPNVTVLARLCRIFQVSADWLLFGGKEDADGGQERDRDAVKASASGDQSRE